MSSPVIIRYTLFQIPELVLLISVLYGLHSWFSVPPWMLWLILGIFVTKDIILFFFIRQAYEIGSARNPRLEGAEGFTIEEVNPQGYVEVHGELWKSKSDDNKPIRAHQKVEVVDHKGLLLIVRSKNKI